jgi:hypothetical protein
MHKGALGGLIVGLLGSGIGVVDAAYIIKLKNGNEYVTTRYWQKGSQVLFDTFGGVFGVERNFVTRIEKSDQAIRLARITSPESAEKTQTDAGKQDTDSLDAKPAQAKTEKKREPDDPILGEFNRLKEKSREVDGMLTSEIRDLLREIKAFKDKISNDSKLFVNYGREFNDVHEVGSVVESALQSRR